MSRRRLPLAAATAALTVVLALPMSAVANDGSNTVTHWCAGGYGFKYEPVATPFVVPAAPDGWTWTLAVVKAGSGPDANATYPNPQPGALLTHPSGHANSHIILCKARQAPPTTTTTTTEVAPSTTPTSTSTAPTTSTTSTPTTQAPPTSSTSVASSTSAPTTVAPAPSTSSSEPTASSSSTAPPTSVTDSSSSSSTVAVGLPPVPPCTEPRLAEDGTPVPCGYWADAPAPPSLSNTLPATGAGYVERGTLILGALFVWCGAMVVLAARRRDRAS